MENRMPDTITSSKKPLALALAGFAAALAVFTVSLGDSGAAAAPAARQNVIGTAAAAGQFKTLLSLVKQARLVGALSGPGPITLFAPTDAAFKAVPKATLRQLAGNEKALRRVPLYHVVEGNFTAARVVALKSTKTLAGPKISIQVRGGSVFLNGSTKVVTTDVPASNGTIHVVNKVLLPPTS
jgi:uncharacterized surface protein with fasciclin (FAS1) repeats